MTLEIKYITLTDPARNREIPCKIYAGGAVPIVFSHGLAGSMESYKYLGEAMAEAGFFAVFPNHEGIDAKLLKEKRPFQAVKDAAADPENLMRPAQDVSFVIDWLEQQDELDCSKIGIGGHSWGAFTTLQLSGQKHTSKGVALTTKDPRAKAAFAISPAAPSLNPEEAFSGINIPMFHTTGTKDDSPVGLTTPEDRQIPFKLINADGQYLIVYEGADHMVFAAQRRGNKFSELDYQIMESTAACAVGFFKKYLSGEESPIDNDEFYVKLPAQNSNQRK